MDSVEIEAPLRIPAGRHALPPEEVGRLQRERLLRSVIACSARDGYQSTTIADIVARAEVSRTAFYEQFESKEECFLTAYAETSAAMREAVVQSGRDAPAWPQALDLGIATYFTWFSERPEVAAAFLVEIRVVGGPALDARSRVLEQMTARVRLLGERARHEQPQLPELGDIAYMSIIATTDEMAHDYVRRGRTRALPELIAPSQEFARYVFQGGGRR
ncbi:MAG: TetR/AcrR family transcriptional regulator [Thermoleophilaceae bacterium]